MDDDREIRDLLAREIQDPDLRRRIFALLDRDPATLTPQEQELFEETVGGILSAETERLRADAERLRGPSWWLRGGGREEAYDDISVRGFLWSLRWIAPGLLVVCLVMWRSGHGGCPSRGPCSSGSSLTVAVGPPIWLRSSVRRGTPRWWRALGYAVLWWLGMLALLGLGYALVTAVFSGT